MNASKSWHQRFTPGATIGRDRCAKCRRERALAHHCQGMKQRIGAVVFQRRVSSPSSRAAWSAAMPSTASVFRLAASPRTTTMLARGKPRVSARKRTSSRLAFPSTGAPATRILSASP